MGTWTKVDNYDVYSEDGKNLFALYGLNSTEGITVSDSVVTLTKANIGNSARITFNNSYGESYILALANDVDQPKETKAAGFDGLAYKAAVTSAGYTLSDDKKTVIYEAEVKGTALFTLKGVKSTDGITVADKVVRLTAANLDGKNVTFNGGVTIILLRLAELVRRKRPAKALTAFPTSR